jgi:hypothetical protein
VSATRRGGIIVAWALAIGANGCDGSIDLLPLAARADSGVGMGAGADSGGRCAPAPPGKPGPMGPAPMMPVTTTPSVTLDCDDSGPCPPMMPACELDPDAGLLDGPAVTP